jgi:hypothetical protein
LGDQTFHLFVIVFVSEDLAHDFLLVLMTH